MDCPIGTQRTRGSRPIGAERLGGPTMDVLQAAGSTFERQLGGAGVAATVTELPLRCVWSEPVEGCSCRSRIDREVVARAWRRELNASGDREARFFHFIWD